MIKEHTDQLTETIDALNQVAASAISNECVDEFEQFEKKINELEGYVREIQQEMWSTQIEEAVDRLSANEALTDLRAGKFTGAAVIIVA